MDYGDDAIGWYDTWPALFMIYGATSNTGGPTHCLLVLGAMEVGAARHKVIRGVHCGCRNGGGVKVSGVLRFAEDTMNMSCATMISSEAKW